MSILRPQRRAMGRWFVRWARASREAILGKTGLDVIENPPRRILMIRPYFLGDILLCLPVAQAIKQRWPEARITWLVREEWTDLLRGHSVVDEVIPFSQRKMHSIRAPAEFFRVMVALRRCSPDLVLSLSWDRSTAMWSGLSGATLRLGIEEYGRPRLFSLFHTSTVVAPDRSEDRRHMADFYYEPLRLLGFEARTELPRIFPTDEEQARVDLRLSSSFIPPPSSFILLHPGGRLNNKRWLPERFAELIRDLIGKIPHKIVLVCGPGEEPWASSLAESAFSSFRTQSSAFSHPSSVLRPQSSVLFWPSPSLGELMALTKRATLFVGNDSGAMHLAAAAGCRVVTIFGTDPSRWGPLGTGHRVVGGSKGLQKVSVEEMLNAILAELKSE